MADQPKTLTRVELDSVSCTCGREGCRGRNHGIAARCHRDAGLEVIYIAEHGHVVLVCKVCQTGVARIQVAWKVPS